MPNKWSIRRPLIALCLLAAATPAQAGLFDSTPAKPEAVSDATIAQIQQAFEDQRYLDAGTLLDHALLSAGNDPRLTYWAGQLNMARGRYSDALANFKSIDSDAKMMGLAREGEGIALIQLGRGEDAVPVLQAAVAGNPAAWRAWNALASEFDRRHDWADADTAYG